MPPSLRSQVPSDEPVCDCGQLASNSLPWVRQMARAFCPHETAMPPLRVCFPTTREVRDSLEGWAAGASIPCHDSRPASHILNQLVATERAAARSSYTAHLCRWAAGERERAVPHLKCFTRCADGDAGGGTDGDASAGDAGTGDVTSAPERRVGQLSSAQRVPWVVMGSHNFSKAAWGELNETGNALLGMRSYELSVLVLPSELPAGTAFPLPHLPVTPYTGEDTVWQTTWRSTSISESLPAGVAGNTGSVDHHGKRPEDYAGHTTRDLIYGPAAAARVLLKAWADGQRPGYLPPAVAQPTAAPSAAAPSATAPSAAAPSAAAPPAAMPSAYAADANSLPASAAKRQKGSAHDSKGADSDEEDAGHTPLAGQSSSRAIPGPPARPTQTPPECECGPMRLHLSSTPKNPNRWFFRCPTFGPRECKWAFKWADELEDTTLAGTPVASMRGGGGGGHDVASSGDGAVGGAASGARGGGSRSSDTCYKCHQKGHWARNCPMSNAPRRKRALEPQPLDPLSDYCEDATDDDCDADGGGDAASCSTAAYAVQSARHEYVVVGFVSEDAACSALLGRLRAACEPSVHAACFQYDGTRHFTLYKLSQLTAEEASCVRLAAPPARLPITLRITRFNPMPKCVALGLDKAGATALCLAVPSLVGLPPHHPSAKLEVANLHVSLYRQRKLKWSTAQPEFDRMRTAVGWGSALGDAGFGSVMLTRIAIKRVGEPYDESRTL